MAINARYVHTNLIAGDWKKLVRFYRNVFGCIPRGPEGDLSGEWLDRVTSLSAACLRGVHLRLPGYGDTGPTLEIFSYDDMPDRRLPMPNEPGFAHGGSVGEVATTEVDGVGSLQVVYARDPEGNIVELQKWS
jgi:catechol 2,3-dioxygenase-like lactoylglutathione lyase family enzyme